MSKYVDEILKDIYTNKEFWCKRANGKWLGEWNSKTRHRYHECW